MADDNRTGDRVTRAEWIAAAALGVSLLQGAYIAGVEVQRLNEHDRRFASIESEQSAAEAKLNAVETTVARIDANVSFLTEMARESRRTHK